MIAPIIPSVRTCRFMFATPGVGRAAPEGTAPLWSRERRRDDGREQQEQRDVQGEAPDGHVAALQASPASRIGSTFKAGASATVGPRYCRPSSAAWVRAISSTMRSKATAPATEVGSYALISRSIGQSSSQYGRWGLQPGIARSTRTVWHRR
jgi:hypothetical protein